MAGRQFFQTVCVIDLNRREKMVIWLIGISGAGKTTLAKMLKKHYESCGRHVYIIDGDMVRDFYDNDLGYSAEDRRANIKRIMLAAHVLDENDVLTVVANISPFDDLRLLARAKIKKYNQVYLKKSLKKSMEDDVKGIYRENMGKTEIIGHDISFDEPTENDLLIQVEDMTPDESCRMIIEFINRKYGKEFES